jgi:hypothetical protein
VPVTLYPQADSWYSFLLEAESQPSILGAIVQVEGLGQLKNPVTSLGMEPTTFWLVAYCLNHEISLKSKSQGHISHIIMLLPRNFTAEKMGFL